MLLTNKPIRQGVVAPFAAVLMLFLVAMAAFAVDLGWVIVVKNQLQHAADAAALAGTDPLMTGYVQYKTATPANRSVVLKSALDKARTNAKNYGGYNSAGSVSLASIADTDIEFGTMDSSYKYTTMYTSTDFLKPIMLDNGYPNTITITVKRSNGTNGALPLFFAPVLGQTSVNVSALAGATILNGPLTTLTPPAKGNLMGVMPFTYDRTDWYDFVNSGTGTNSKNLVPTLGTDGNFALEVYNDSNYKSKGNFGILSLNDNDAAAKDTKYWIDNGMRSEDISALNTNGLIPLPATADIPTYNKYAWQGSTGFEASSVMAMNDHTYDLYLLPLFKAYQTAPSYQGPYQHSSGKGKGGGGMNTDYCIVEFVGVQIMPVSSTNRQIVVQPSAYVASNVSGSPASTSTFYTTFGYPKLTR